MKKDEVSTAGLFVAVFLSLLGTVGSFLSHASLNMRLDFVWIAVFACSLLTLSGAVVNFDPKRIIK